MKKLLLSMAAIAAFALASCTGEAPSEEQYGLNNVEYIPVCLGDSAGWSMIAPDGKFLFKNKFDNRYDAITVAINGFFSVRNAALLTIYTAEADPKPVQGLSGLTSAGYMSEGKIPVCFPGEPISIMNADGSKAFSLEGYDGHEIVRCDIAFSDGLLWVEDENGKRGYINHYGNVVIPIEYDYAGEFRNGYTLVGKNDIEQILDADGNVIIAFGEGEDCSGIMGHQALTHIGNSYAVVDFDGTRRNLPSQYIRVSYWNKDYIVAGTEDSCKVLRNNDNFDVLFSTDVFFATPLPNNEFFVKIDNGIYSRLNAKGKTLETYENNTVAYFGKRWALMSTSENGRSHFMSLDGKPRSEDFQKFSTRLSLEYCVMSDVFNIDDMVQTFADLLTDKNELSYKTGNKISYYINEADLFQIRENTYCSSIWLITTGKGFRILSNFVSEKVPEGADVMDTPVKYPVYVASFDKYDENSSKDFLSRVNDKFRNAGFVRTHLDPINICMSKYGFNVVISSLYLDDTKIWVVLASCYYGEPSREHLNNYFDDLPINELLSME